MLFALLLIHFILFCFIPAMYGTSPAFTEANLRSYIAYLASPIPLAFDSNTGRPISATSQELKTKSKQAILTFIGTVIMFNILEPTNYAPFPQKPSAESTLGLFYYGNILNNLAAACEYCTVTIPLAHLGPQIAILIFVIDDSLTHANLRHCQRHVGNRFLDLSNRHQHTHWV